jgi:hypothetical protein
MFRRWIWCPALLALLIPQTVLLAQDESSTGNQLMFVPPPVEGSISLGIYDNKGKLVRVLKRSADIESFKAGLNGLLVDWDRNDAQGKPVPPGKYYARGVAIGDVKIEGIAFHLNDWVDQAGQTRPNHIYSIALLSDLRPAMIADTPARSLLLIDPNAVKTASIPLHFEAESVKSNSANVFLFDRAQAASIDPASGAQAAQRPAVGIIDADALGDRNVILTATHLSDQTGAGIPRELTLPEENLSHCALVGSFALVAGKKSKIWKLEEQSFTPLEIGETAELLDMDTGVGETIWLLLKTENTALLKQIDLSGKSVRSIELPPDLQSAAHLAASRTQDALLIDCIDGSTRRTVGLRFQNADQSKSIWEKWIDRSITNFQFFDLKEGRVIASTTRTESAAVYVKPANNPLENLRQPVFQLSVLFDDNGAWVSNSDGLPLFQVCKTKGIKQTRYISDNANGMRVYVSDGCVVEEYHLTRLDNLFRFDAGSFE